MRTNELALPTGQEGVTPPYSDGEATTEELILTELAEARAIGEVTQLESDNESTNQTINDLTRLASGLEGLMIEVVQVENKNDPTEDELAALRVAAMSVRREFMDARERRVVDDIREGRLEGSVEGLGDVIKSVSKKLTFALGNLMDGAINSLKKNRTATDAGRRMLTDLYARLDKLPDTKFTGKLSAKNASYAYLNGKFDLNGCLEDVAAAVDAWYLKPLVTLSAKIKQLDADLAKIFACKDEEAYTKATTAAAAHFEVPLAAGSRKIDTTNTKTYVLDIYITHESFIGRGLTTVIARPEPATNTAEPYYDRARSVNASFSNITQLSKLKAVPNQVTLTKAQLLSGIKQLQKALDLLDSYEEQMSVTYKLYEEYCRTVKMYDDFYKRDFVTKAIQHRVNIHAGAIIALFEMTSQGVAGTMEGLGRLAKLVKGLVYSSDLSGGE